MFYIKTLGKQQFLCSWVYT